MPYYQEPLPDDTPKRGLFRRRTSEVSREKVTGIDKIERQISLLASAIALALGAILLGGAIIDKGRWHHYSLWLPQFALIVVAGVAMLVFTLRAKRAGIAFCGLFIGLALGTIGLPFLALGGWLIVRAFRLQKYGDATFAGSNKIARERAKAKREGRTVTPRATRGSARGSSRNAVKLPTGPEASKRYTPKKQVRKR